MKYFDFAFLESVITRFNTISYMFSTYEGISRFSCKVSGSKLRNSEYSPIFSISKDTES